MSVYSRKSAGYFPSVPPPGYNGVTFSRNYQPSPNVRIPAKSPESAEDADEDIPREEPMLDAQPTEPAETAEPAEDTQSEEAGYDAGEGAGHDILNDIASKEFRMEDLLLIGAVLLFVSGDLDGDIMLLLGLLLVAGI